MPPDPLTTTAALSAAGAWLWEKYGKSLTDKVGDKVKDQWSEFKWDEAAKKYRAKVIKLYGTMQIMGMREPVPLDDIFTDAYMLDKPTALARDRARARDLALDLGLDGLAEELAALSLPTAKATAAEWQEFAHTLRALMIKHRDIGHEWDLTITQEARLADYLNATRLLRDCLELAFMPPDEKMAVLNSLYLPLTQDGEGPHV